MNGTIEATISSAPIQRQDPNATVLVNGARDARYQTIMSGIDLIKDAGIGKVSLVSLPAEGR